MYNPNDGKFYSATLKIVNRNMLELRGYLGFSWLGKTVVWTRKKYQNNEITYFNSKFNNNIYKYYFLSKRQHTIIFSKGNSGLCNGV